MIKSYLETLQEKINNDKHEINDICTNCNGKLIRENESNMVCESCGKIENLLGGKYCDGTVNNIEGFLDISSDKGGKICNSIVNTKNLQLNNIIKIYKKKQTINDKVNIPDWIFNKAANFYVSIVEQSGSSRASVLMDVLAVCLHQECKRNSCMYTERQIAKFMGLKKEGLSGGLKKLNYLNLTGKIYLDKSNDIYLKYLEKYLDTLELNEKYAVILEQTILNSRNIIADNYNTEIQLKYNLIPGKKYKLGSDCRIVTKCAGIIYALIKVLKKHKEIPISRIEEVHSTKKTTFNKFTIKIIQYDELLNFTNSILSICCNY